MLGLSSVIAYCLYYSENLFALTPLIPLFQACAGFAIRSPACEGVKTQNRVHGSILICTRCDSGSYRFQGISSHITAIQATGTRSNARARPAVPSARS
jgi:hypothetical protein